MRQGGLRARPRRRRLPILKVERVARKTYRTRDQARADVFDYIERFITRDAGTPRSAILARWSSNNERD
jgi:hypothetical protein